MSARFVCFLLYQIILINNVIDGCEGLWWWDLGANSLNKTSKRIIYIQCRVIIECDSLF